MLQSIVPADSDVFNLIIIKLIKFLKFDTTKRSKIQILFAFKQVVILCGDDDPVLNNIFCSNVKVLLLQ